MSAAERTGAALAIALAAVLAGLLVAAPAGAHVTVTPTEAAAGQPATLAFRVPNERSTSGTVRVELVLPPDHPIPGVAAGETPGWTAELRVAGGFVRSVVWTGGPLTGTQAATFRISTGPLPGDTEELVFSAVQGYESGEVVTWNERAAAGAAEPQHPAPVVEVAGGVNPVPTTTTAAPAVATTTVGDDPVGAGPHPAGDSDGDGAPIAPVVGAGLAVLAAGVVVAVLRRSGGRAR